MPDLVQLMNEYRTVPLSESGEAPRKLEIIARLEDELEVPAVQDFLLAVLRDAGEYDLARIEICRVLAAASRDRLDPGVVGDTLTAHSWQSSIAVRTSQLLVRWGGRDTGTAL